MKPVLTLSLLLLATTARAANSTYADFLTTARTQFDAKNFEAARATMQNALRVAKTPEEKSQANFRIGKTFDEQKLFARAREFYAQAAAQAGVSDADKTAALFSVGDSFHKEDRLDEAQKAFESLLAEPKTLGDFTEIVRFNLGQVLLESGQADKGRELLSRVGVSETVPFVRASAWLEVARSLSEQKQWDAARIASDKALAVPETPLFFQASAHAERIKTFLAQNNAQSAQDEKNAWVFDMMKPLGTSTPGASFGRIVSTPPQLDPKKKEDLPIILERLSAALLVVDGTHIEPQETLSLTLREQIAENYLAQGDIASARAGFVEFLGFFAPTSNVPPAARAGASVLQNVALWQLAGMAEREGDTQSARSLWGRLLSLPDVAPFYKNAAQKKLDGAK